MKILISNDDGYDAPGILALAEAMRELGEATIVAPDRNKSGASNSLTLTAPIRARKINDTTYCVEGTPTDCVHVALTGLLDEKPDIVVSGVNAGLNLGDDVLYSGTVAAAMEGRCVGKPAVAISLLEPCDHYATAAQVAKILVERLIADPLPADTILNVNVPNVPFDQLDGFEVTRLGSRHRAENAIPDTDPRGKPIYWIGPAGEEMDNGPGTDFHAVRNNKVSVTPIQIDLTNYKAFDQVSHWMKGV